METRKEFNKGELVWVEFLNKKHRYDDGTWVRGLGLVLDPKNTLQIAKIYVPEHGLHLKRVPYKFLSAVENKKS